MDCFCFNISCCSFTMSHICYFILFNWKVTGLTILCSSTQHSLTNRRTECNILIWKFPIQTNFSLGGSILICFDSLKLSKDSPRKWKSFSVSSLVLKLLYNILPVSKNDNVRLFTKLCIKPVDSHSCLYCYISGYTSLNYGLPPPTNKCYPEAFKSIFFLETAWQLSLLPDFVGGRLLN